ncbi:MAG: LysM peptidoglycan-binding domain-containing protein [Bacilli bacterium]|nr:LysM peptidoglycan-binding domain-containing protein [Bacilli bacterium]
MIKNLNIRRKKKFFKGAIFGLVLTAIGGTGVYKWKDNEDKVVLNAKDDTTIHQLAKKLNYDEDELRDLNDDIENGIRRGQEFTIRLSDLKKTDYKDYKIKKKDTLSKISAKFGINTDSLEKFDDRLESDEELSKHIGEKVSLFKRNEPKIRTVKYVVKSGDNLIGIVNNINKYLDKKVSLESVLEQNKLKSGSVIYPNQKLKITVMATKHEVKQIKKHNNKKIVSKNLNVIKGKDEIEKKYGKLRGIDISSHNEVDWEKLNKSGDIDFVILRLFDGYNMDYNEESKDGTLGRLNKIDSKFFKNAEMCKKYNIPFGIYTYTRATTEKQAEIEANKVVNILSKADIRPTYPIYYDVESQASEPLKNKKGKLVSSVDYIRNNPDQIIANFKAYADVLESNNYYCGLYTNNSAINNIDPTGDKLKEYTIWYSRYTGYENSFSDNVVMKDNYKGNIGMYQFTSQGRVKGVKGYVDCNYCKIDYSKIIKKLGMNKPIKKEEEKTKH